MYPAKNSMGCLFKNVSYKFSKFDEFKKIEKGDVISG
jgi:hypothetical protein